MQSRTQKKHRRTDRWYPVFLNTKMLHVKLNTHRGATRERTDARSTIVSARPINRILTQQQAQASAAGGPTASGHTSTGSVSRAQAWHAPAAPHWQAGEVGAQTRGSTPALCRSHSDSNPPQRSVGSRSSSQGLRPPEPHGQFRARKGSLTRKSSLL